MVNMLLSMIDGVNALNNVLLIGMTNRVDLIDKAILRPGRFSVHVKIGLPSEEGRAQILKIQTKDMRANGILGESVDLDQIAQRAKNYTGAELEQLVSAANTHAFNRQYNL